jgi:O-antigen/teichoic acid export membrane protein
MLSRQGEKTKNVPSVPVSARRSLGAKIIRNVLFGGLRYLLVLPVPFIVTPIILHKIGAVGYGTWAVFLAINGLTSLADLGLVGTVSKFVAEYFAREDFPSLSRLLSSGLALFLGIDTAICISGWLASPLLAGRLFHGSSVPASELTFLLRCFLLVVAANVLTQLFASVTTGLQRLDLTNMMSAANTLMNALFGVSLLLRGRGLAGLVFGYVGSSFVTIAIYTILVHRLLPKVGFNPLRFDSSETRKMFGYSFRLYFTQAAVVVHNQVEKLFLALLAGVTAVGWYDIASDIATKVRGSIGFILAPVLPAASELDALGDESRLKELYFRTHKYLALLGVPLICYTAVIAPRFVELWIGPSMRIVALPMSVLLVMNYVNLMTGPGFLVLAGRGDLKPGMQSAMLGIAVNVVASFGLIYVWGFSGAVLGTSASLMITTIYFVSIFHRRTGYEFLRVPRESYLKPILFSVLLLGVLLIIHPAKNLSWFGLVAMGIVFGVLYGVSILLSRFFDEYDWNKIENFVPVVRHARRIRGIA